MAQKVNIFKALLVLFCVGYSAQAVYRQTVTDAISVKASIDKKIVSYARSLDSDFETSYSAADNEKVAELLKQTGGFKVSAADLPPLD